jgi:predicted transposase/invertase (TIGR01784 family)
LKHADELEVIPDSADTVALRHAYDVANQFSWTKEELEVYEYWGIKEQDERGAVQYALRTGLKEGIQQGIQQGAQQERLATARKMLAKGYAIADICELTGLSAEEVAALVEEEQG